MTFNSTPIFEDPSNKNVESRDSSLENTNIRKLPNNLRKDFRAVLRERERVKDLQRRIDEGEEDLQASNLGKEIRKLPNQAMQNFRALVDDTKDLNTRGKAFVKENAPINLAESTKESTGQSNIKPSLAKTKESIEQQGAPVSDKEVVRTTNPQKASLLNKSKNYSQDLLKSKSTFDVTDSAEKLELDVEERSSRMQESLSTTEKSGTLPFNSSIPDDFEGDIKKSFGEDIASAHRSLLSSSIDKGVQGGILESSLDEAKPVSDAKEGLIPISTQKESPPPSPFVIGRDVISSEKLAKEPTWASMVKSETDSIIHHRDASSGVIKQASRFNVEHPDMPYINLMSTTGLNADTIQQNADNANVSATVQLKEVVEQIIKHLYVLESSGKTDTIIVLKNPPLFEGAQVVITSYSTATKEFNLAFENLRPDAQKLINDNINSLRIALAESGAVKALHIVTTTTLVEHHLPEFTESDKSRERGEGQKERERGNKEEDLA